MSAATITRQEYAITLKAPNATRPTQDTNFRVSDVYVGPKRTVRRERYNPNLEIRFFVPDYPTWTLDTLRMALHELATLLPGEPAEEHVTAEVGDASYPAAGSVWIRVSAPALDGNSRHRVEAGFTIDKNHLSEPMRAAIAALPRVPLALSAIDDPETQGEDEMPAADLPSETEQQLQRIVATLRDLALVDPSYVSQVDRLVELLEKHRGDE